MSRHFKKVASTALAIRFLRKGCCNRPFFHIIVVPNDSSCTEEGIEQLGSFDPMPNERNEKLLALNIERFQYWVAQGAGVRRPVAEVLGLAGVLPLHPYTLAIAWKNRQSKLNDEQTEHAESAAQSN